MKKVRGLFVAMLLLSVSAPIVSLATDEVSTTSSIKKEQTSPVLEVKNILVKDVNLPIGVKWDASLGFNGVEMSDGTKLTWKDVMNDIVITGNVNSEQPGTYPVTYTYGNKKATMNVTVKIMEVVKVQMISLKDINLPLGVEWQPVNSFNYIEMSDGTKLSWDKVAKDIKVTGTVDSQKQGVYKVSFSYEDQQATANVTVKDMEVIKVQEISVKDINIPIGEKWDASQNFNYILLSNGVKLYWKDVFNDIKVTVDKDQQTIDTTQPETHKVTYTYDDKSATANVTVGIFEIIKVQQIVLKNTTISNGSKWQTSDNFVTAKMSDGTERSWAEISKDIKITGTVDTSKDGVYKVTYGLDDKEETATITVTSKKILPQTGERKSTVMFAIGALLIPLAAGILIYKKKRS